MPGATNDGDALLAATTTPQSTRAEAIAKLQRQGELALRRRADRQPLGVRPLMALAETQRGQGDLAAAAETYAQVAAARVGDWRKAAWLHAMLRGEQLPFVPPRGVWPVPFVHIDDFLPRTAHERVHAIVLSLAPGFAAARVGDDSTRRVDESHRRGLAIDNADCDALRRVLVPRLRALLPGVQRRLRLKPRAASHRIGTVDLAAYPHDGFGGAHCDSGPRHYSHQGLTAVYFCHREPRAFNGGDLLLYDTDVATGAASEHELSRIAPASNSLVLMPHTCCHAVARVASRSRALADARLSACLTVLDDMP